MHLFIYYCDSDNDNLNVYFNDWWKLNDHFNNNDVEND